MVFWFLLWLFVCLFCFVFVLNNFVPVMQVLCEGWRHTVYLKKKKKK